MDKNLPDKWIRKAIHEAINNNVIDGKTINAYDYAAGEPDPIPEAYVIISTQSNQVEKSQKCRWRWRSFATVEINIRQAPSGTGGSRLLADNILDVLRSNTHNLTLDLASNLEIITQTESFPDDLYIDDGTVRVYRKFIQYEFLIN